MYKWAGLGFLLQAVICLDRRVNLRNSCRERTYFCAVHVPVYPHASRTLSISNVQLHKSSSSAFDLRGSSRYIPEWRVVREEIFELRRTPNKESHHLYPVGGAIKYCVTRLSYTTCYELATGNILFGRRLTSQLDRKKYGPVKITPSKFRISNKYLPRCISLFELLDLFTQSGATRICSV